MNLEQTLILLKPDAIERGLTGEILRRIEAKGYRVKNLRMLTVDDALLAEHYAEHIGQPYYEGMTSFMKSGATVAAVIEGIRVIEGVRNLCGSTIPTDAAPGTIRGDLGHEYEDGIIHNLIHSSDSAANAAREIKIWFGE
ncbi:MAG: nucleoside-diphosphate kinase [Trueperella sp.]|nr:nucleoside-diphosphate kinase [Trueperella sp.]